MAHFTFELESQSPPAWIWKRIDRQDEPGAAVRSSTSFASFLECVADAAHHGYKPEFRVPQVSDGRGNGAGGVP